MFCLLLCGFMTVLKSNMKELVGGKVVLVVLVLVINLVEIPGKNSVVQT